MTGAVAALAFLPGLAIGSFLNVVAARIPARISIASPRSSCPGCATEIAWYDNIPLLSYVLLRGRCRGCTAADLARSTRLVELSTAVLVSACILDFGVTRDARSSRRSSVRRSSSSRSPTSSGGSSRTAIVLPGRGLRARRADG